MNIYPYVYRLDHPITGEFYIGFRCANKVPAELDLGHKYFTSSKSVKPRFNEFTITIVAEFFDRDAAYELEQQLIHENWGATGLLNLYYQYNAIKYNCPKHSTESKKKIADAWKRRSPMSDETKQKLSDALKGKNTKPKTNETKQKMSDAAKGKPKSEAHKKKMSEAAKNRKTSYK